MADLRQEILDKCPEIVHDEAKRDIAVQRIYEKINLNRKTIQSAMVSRRGLYSRYEGGAIAAKAVLTKLQTFSQTQGDLPGVLKDMLVFLDSPEGIDFGDAEVQRLLSYMAILPNGAPITVDEANKLKALALKPSEISIEDIKREVWSDNGEWKLGE